MQETVKVNIIVDDDDWTKCGSDCRYLSYHGCITHFRCNLFFDDLFDDAGKVYGYMNAKLAWDEPNLTSKKTRCDKCLNCMRGE